MNDLKAKAYAMRRDVLDMVYRAKTGHIGGDFSVMDILTALYFKEMNISPQNQDDPDRDYFVMSKGHSVEAYYAVLAAKGFFPAEEVKEQFSVFGSKYIGHPNNKLPGIEMNSGSLGHGLPVCVGIAKACRMDKRPSRVYTVMGDGELAEGSVWEGVMAASQYSLDNLLAVVDRNRLQISGCTEDIMHHDDLAARFAAFGWEVLTADGNDTDALLKAFERARKAKGRPAVVIADTIKGCGVSFMENAAEWHHKVPTAQQYEQAVRELTEKEEAARNE
ncbi:transketolase [Blautia hominis]|uniref:Transketolase n=1 Tax=Blautia hominis TaxID=2025493 RepID=A0ABQ0B3U2_9FIRM